jgi:hypothetical protein
MIPYAWFGRMGMAMVALTLVAAIGTPAIAAPRVKGDGSAWNEIVMAFQKLNELPGYREKITVSDGTVGSAEYAPPSFHWTVQKSGGSIETFAVGNARVVRTIGPGIPGGAICRKESGSTTKPFLTDLRDVTGEITVTRKSNTEIDGTSVRVYAIDKIEDGARSTGAAYLGAQNGLPRRVVDPYPSDDGPVTATIDFYDYGAQIAIALPNC